MKTPNPDLVEEIVRRVTSAVHPLRVILFGSAARGEMSPERREALGPGLTY